MACISIEKEGDKHITKDHCIFSEYVFNIYNDISDVEMGDFIRKRYKLEQDVHVTIYNCLFQSICKNPFDEVKSFPEISSAPPEEGE